MIGPPLDDFFYRNSLNRLGNNSPVEGMLTEGGRRRGEKLLFIYLESTKYEAISLYFIEKQLAQ
jgi:hypothetical protein